MDPSCPQCLCYGAVGGGQRRSHSLGQLPQGGQELGLLSGATTVKSLTWEVGSNLCCQVSGSR